MTKKDNKKESEQAIIESEILKKQLEDKEKTLKEYTNTLQRIQADFDNYTKRVKKEKEELEKYASAKLAAKILAVADDFDRTVEAAKNIQNEEITQGMTMVQKHIQKILGEEGIKPINVKGAKFDPFMHEIIDLREGKDNTIIEEVQKGYTMHDKVLRTSKVIVGKQKNIMEETKNVQ